MNPKQLLITGANGQLGKALRKQYPEAAAFDSSQLDISSGEQLNCFDWSPFTTILNAAAYTAVDAAETWEGRQRAWAVNAHGTANLAKIAVDHDLTLVHISSDYIFDGTKTIHAENELFAPLGVYGQSKAAGDLAVSMTPKHYILPVSWVIGDGKNFVRTMIGLAQKSVSPTVVADQIGRPIFTTELVRVIDHFLHVKPDFGTYHVSNGGNPISWADLTRAIFSEMKVNLQVFDTTTNEYFADRPEAAPRPLNSLFDLSKLESTGFTSHDWREDLKNYIEEETKR